jgi:ABC-type sugar transport system ATPase subunit
MADPILEFRAVSKTFGGVRALREVSFAIPRGEIHALVGENGAGKSTLIRICGGLFAPDSGTVLYEGRELRIDGAHASREAGIGIVHQEIPICRDLTAAENVFLGQPLPRRAGLVDWAAVNRRAGELFERLRSDIRPDDIAGELTIAQQQTVVIAQALSLEAKLLIMDEPTSALSKQESVRLFEILRQLRDQGITIVYVSHRLEEVFNIADRITALRDGRHVGTAPKSEVSPERVVQMMVGREISNLFPKQVNPRGSEPLLSVRGLTARGLFEDISFNLHGGEVLGLVGLQGSGSSAVLRAIFGQIGGVGGDILVRGRRARLTTSLDAISAGIAYVPGDRQTEGLFPSLSIVENASLVKLPHFANAIGWIPSASLRNFFKDVVSRFSIKAGSGADLVTSLSGGNQQKVVIARSLSVAPLIVLLDDPTRGIDVGAKAEVHHVLNRLTAQGCGVILASSELQETLAMSDRVLVMYRGRVRAELARSEAEQEKVMTIATGADLAPAE